MKTELKNPFNHLRTQEIFEELKMKRPKLFSKERNFIRVITSDNYPKATDRDVQGNIFVEYDIKVDGNIFKDMTKTELKDMYTRDNYRGLAVEFFKLVEQSDLHKKIVSTGATFNMDLLENKVVGGDISMHHISYYGYIDRETGELKNDNSTLRFTCVYNFDALEKGYITEYKMDISKQKKRKYRWFAAEEMIYDFTGMDNIERVVDYTTIADRITEKQFWFAKKKAEQGIKVVLQ